MKKMFMILIAFTMMTGLFAYEPKKECVTVKGNKVYYEETGRWGEKIKWSYKIKSGKFIYYSCSSFDDMWYRLCGLRESYDLNLEVASFKDEKCSTCDFLETYKSAYENNELNETEMKQYESILKLHLATNDVKGAIEGRSAHAKTATKSYYEISANDKKRNAIDEIPFVTEENWYTITREEILDKIHAFAEEVVASNK